MVIKQSTWLANAAPGPDQQALATSGNMYNPYRGNEGGTQQVCVLWARGKRAVHKATVEEADFYVRHECLPR